ncbi:SDR family NAD(P)-dependent oxidoreductase [Devosia submarina]|uniref:SDR family NAD(P)-dependent oxidoreductase n=1 Tax=Devosia submarina TaxID=1173082 RepID=UPI000D3858F5|nr:SDR family NAD(P)-dependent oxidoreductase [Devosia submarina]
MTLQPGVAWIIGGGSGIGAAVARLLAEQGWIVAISGRRSDKLAEVAARNDGIRTYRLDVTDKEAVQATIQRIVRELGRIDLFIFGAVASQPMEAGDYDFTPFQAIVDTNFLSLVRAANPVIAQMERQGGGHFAAIASVAGYFGLPRAAAYSSTKAAMISLLETMRTELAARNIKVRMIAPGFVKSELTDRNEFQMPFLMETDEAARRIVDRLTRTDAFEIAFPRRMVWTMKALRLLPYPLFFRITDMMLRRSGK